MSAIEVLKKFRYTDEKVSVNQLHNALDVALLALEKGECPKSNPVGHSFIKQKKVVK